MNSLAMMLGGLRRIGLDGVIDSRVLCCLRFVDTRLVSSVTGAFLNGETITVWRSGLMVATAVVDCVLSTTKLALHGATATINAGDTLMGNTSSATATASTGAVELVDVGPGKYTVTNSGMTAGDVGSGPFTGDRSIVDPSLVAYCVVSNAAFNAANAAFFRVKPEYIAGGAAPETIFKFSTATNATGPTVEVSVLNHDATRVKFQGLLRTTGTASPQYYGWSNPVLPGAFYDIYINFTAGLKAYCNGSLFYDFSSGKPSFGTTPVMMLGRYSTGTTVYAAAGNSIDSAVLFNADVATFERVTPSTRYRYPSA